MTSSSAKLHQLIENRSAKVGVIGLGYVGLPVAMAIAKAGFPVIGFDVDAAKTDALNHGLSYIDAVKSETLKLHISAASFKATTDNTKLAE